MPSTKEVYHNGTVLGLPKFLDPSPAASQNWDLVLCVYLGLEATDPSILYQYGPEFLWVAKEAI